MQTTTVSLPARLEADAIPNVIASIAPLLDAADAGTPVSVDFTAHTFCDPAGVVMLGAAGARYYRLTRHQAKLVGWDDDSYLSRLELGGLFGLSHRFKLRFPRPRDFVALREVVEPKDRVAACDAVAKILGIHHAGATGLMGYTLEEVLRNVDDHADSPTNALLHAQRYDRTDEVVVAIADTGQGVLRSLRQQQPDLGSDRDALYQALLPGVSGKNVKKARNQGIGLTATARMIAGVNGSMQVISGKAMQTISRDGTIETELPGRGWPGVVVVLRVSGRDNIDWDDVRARALREVGR